MTLDTMSKLSYDTRQMLSSDRFEARSVPLGADPWSATRAGIDPTRVRPATIDRLVWNHKTDVAGRRLSRPGVERAPIATGRHSTMHQAIDTDAAPCFVRRTTPRLAAGYAAAHDLVRALGPGAGFAAPAIRRVDDGEVWLHREAWAVPATPSPSAVSEYVFGVLGAALWQGTVVATGRPHVLAGGRIVCEDVLVARQLETDERALLAGIITALTHGDPRAVAGRVQELCRTNIPGIVGAAQRSCLSVRAAWSPVSFGLALSHVAAASAPAGVRSEALVLLADELLHRLDLAHEHHCGVERFADRLETVLSHAS
jgi:hypothetical protein